MLLCGEKLSGAKKRFPSERSAKGAKRGVTLFQLPLEVPDWMIHSSDDDDDDDDEEDKDELNSW